MGRFRFAFWVVIWAAIGIACVAAETAEHARSPIPSGPGASPAANGAAPADAQAISTGLPIPADQVVTHLSHSVAWYRGIIGLQQIPVDPDDVVPRDRLNQTALTALQLAFDFGHASAGLAAAKPAAPVHPAAAASSAAGSSAGAGAAVSGGAAGAPGVGRPTNATPGAPAASASGGTPTTAAPASTAAKPGSSASEQSQGQAGEIDQAAARLADRVSTLQSQLTALNDQIARAPASDKPTLIAQRDEASAALDLTKEIQGTVSQIQRFQETSDVNGEGGAGGLAAQVAELQKTVPELRQVSTRHGGGAGDGSCGSGGGSAAGGSASGGSASGGSGGSASGGGGGSGGTGGSGGAGGSGSGSSGSGSNCSSGGSGGSGSSGSGSGGPSAPAPAAPAAPAPASTEAFRPESAGVIALIGRWFSLEGAKGQLSDAIKQTDSLTKELDALRGTVTQEARSFARQNLDTTSTDTAQLAQARQQFQAAAIRFKQLSRLLIPLGEQGITVENARNILSDWRDSIAAKNGTVARYLALHLGFLLGSIAVVLVISDIWRRATFRYLSDSRRRQQFLALRRVAVGIALTVVIVFGLVSEVGSLATYAGLITAGLAVALQNVILAVVAYFFLIGRYGVRVGDRVTLAGVTGRVVEIGLIRIYLMELVGPELRSSGRMVVLSNAVLFQPTALFKQMPGGDYAWHTILLTLAPSTDVSLAEKRLSEAADSVYQNYRTAIEQQHAALQRFIDFETAMPQPEVYVRLTEKGLECTVRYPVEPARAAAIDQTMLNALREAQAKEPPLEAKGGPILTTVDA